MLIDTILRDVPMPKVFLWNELIGGSTHRRVIDGQQRLSAILAFLRDEFALETPYDGVYLGKRFSELPEHEQEHYLRYRIDFNEALGFSEADVREVYSRVNKYSLPLNKQELRKADYPGDFLKLASKLSLDPFMDEQKVFSVGQRRRMGDIEFTAELLAGMLEGPQDKKGDLDYFFSRYATWSVEEIEKATAEFIGVIADMKMIFAEDRLSMRKTRFHQRADFYSLYMAIRNLRVAGYTLTDKDLSPLQDDFRLLHEFIAPTSGVEILSEYAIKCVSQANSIASRAWRRDLLTVILNGTYRATRPLPPDVATFSNLFEQIGSQRASPVFDDCVVCGTPMIAHQATSRKLDWSPDATVFQLSNAGWSNEACATNRPA